MGAGRWSSDDYTSYTRSTGYTTKSTAEVFSNRNLHASLDPSKIVLRESCDSEQNPNSTPIIFALDVTGSMGQYADQIARTELPLLIGGVYERTPVSDPHVMFMGIGDVHYPDRAPLQVSQFEASAPLIVESLRSLWLEGGGGGNSFESYDLAWYFAAYKTAIDSFKKRGKKGILFTFGDEEPPRAKLDPQHLHRVFGAGDNPVPTSTAALLQEAEKQYKVFHVVIEEGSHCRRCGADQIVSAWREVMGVNVIRLRNAAHLTNVVLGIIRIAEGEDVQHVIETCGSPEELKYAISME